MCVKPFVADPIQPRSALRTPQSSNAAILISNANRFGRPDFGCAALWVRLWAESVFFSHRLAMRDTSDLSLAESFNAGCPVCGTEFQGLRWLILDADHRPELVVHALDGSLQRTFCPNCIGPGVESPGSFGILKREEGKLQWMPFLYGEPETLAAREESLLAQLNRQAPAVQEMGARWVTGRRDVEDVISDTWPQMRLQFDPVMQREPLLAVLNAGSAKDRAAALIQAPDLARPNMERFLSLMTEQDSGERIAPLLAQYFIASARNLGLHEALRLAEAEEAHSARLRALPSTVAEPLLALMQSSPVNRKEAILALLSAGTAVSQLLDEADFPGPKAEVWELVGGRLRECVDLQDALPLAVEAYGRALQAVDPERANLVCKILVGLSAAWDERTDGNHAEHLEQALQCAAAAREYGRPLPTDRQAELAMEQGILYTRRIAGDQSSNLALAREALQTAIDNALDSRLRMLATYNYALADIEDPQDGDALDRGIARLSALEPIELSRQFFNDLQYQNLLQSLGVALAKRATGGSSGNPEDLDRAADCMERALEMARGRGAAHTAAFLLGRLASIEADRLMRGRAGRDLAQILSLLDESGKVLTPEKAPTDYAGNELLRAQILEDLGQPEFVDEMVTKAYGNACRYLTPESAPDVCRRAQSHIGALRFRQNDYPAAAAAYTVACDASNRVYAATESVERRAAEVAVNAQLYSGLVDSLAYLARDDGDAQWRVLEAMEAGRSRLTLDLMGLRPLPPFPGIPQELLEREAQLIASLAWTVPGAAPDLIHNNPDQLRHQRETRSQLEALWKEIAQTGEGGRRHTSLRQSKPPGPEEMAAFVARLGPAAAVASFFLLPGRTLLVWLRKGTAPRVYPIDLPAAVLSDHWVPMFRRDVLESEPEDSPADHWLALGELLFAPVAAELAGLEVLVLIPHLELHSLPLHALNVAGKPLIEQTPVIYGPSIGVLVSITEGEQAEPREPVALVASHAVAQEEAAEFEGEADTVAERFGTRALHHAQWRAIAERAPSADVIHLVCHGHFDAQNPLDSGVLFADGVMRARDWLPLSLHCGLITLSACETGRQKIQAGDELSGLARTLLQAGSANVLLTLWRVYSDAAADWMSRFYGMPDGTPRAKAFQRATNEMRARDPDVRAWAPFLLTGDTR